MVITMGCYQRKSFKSVKGKLIYKGGVGAAGQRRDIPAPRFNMDDLLKYAVEHGMIDLSYVQNTSNRQE